MRVAAIAGQALLEFVFGEVLHDLGEDGTAEVHPPFCGLLLSRSKQPIPAQSSNRKIQVSSYEYDSAQVIRFQKSLAGRQCNWVFTLGNAAGTPYASAAAARAASDPAAAAALVDLGSQVREYVRGLPLRPGTTPLKLAPDYEAWLIEAMSHG